ncbi:hypothetical protein GSI_08323 [Ganoderma sinense ZZ0214-1]|uniref:Uncharacterized protein n=1 Tax=Ganoderma sinense ZZ0214-1 TaxID=1077348 RepID=A0A2G8S6Z0_9APHY|nr:hypothetical protein GSI_08323 [Ganoderma sinense ZZ0214-1]
MRLRDGMGQLAIGVEFTTAMHERDVEARLKEAVVRLRFECPLVAATIEHGLHHHHPEFGSWVYAPLPNVDAARDWANDTVCYLPSPPIDPESFVKSTIETNSIPYVLADGSEQYLRVYLTRPNGTLNTYFLCLHAAHSIIDGRPGLNALSLLLEWMTASDLPGVDELAWGTEHRNLPPGPINATGGPREDWGTKGAELVERFLANAADQDNSHGVACNTPHPAVPGKTTHRVLVKFTLEESAKIARALKTLGFTFSELVDAACILAAFEQNPVPPDEVETAFMNSEIVVSLTDRLPPPTDPRKHLVSCLAFMLSRTDYPLLGSQPRGRARLLAAMRAVKAQYDWLLANPCLPHLSAELAPRIAPTKAELAGTGKGAGAGAGTHGLTVTNIGRVENYVAPVWPGCSGSGSGRSGSGKAVIRVDEMHLAVRWCNPTVHAWSMHGRLSVLLQASDVWDRDVLEDFMSIIVEQISFVVAE